MTEIDKKEFKNYLYCTFGITYIAWGLLAIYTILYFGIRDIYRKNITYSRCTWTSYCKWLYLKSNNIKFKHFYLIR